MQSTRYVRASCVHAITDCNRLIAVIRRNHETHVMQSGSLARPHPTRLAACATIAMLPRSNDAPDFCLTRSSFGLRNVRDACRPVDLVPVHTEIYRLWTNRIRFTQSRNRARIVVACTAVYGNDLRPFAADEATAGAQRHNAHKHNESPQRASAVATGSGKPTTGGAYVPPAARARV